MKVARLTQLDSSLLKQVNHLTADSFFCSTGFMDVWKSLGGNPVHWLVQEDDAVVACLPGIEFGRRPFARFQSMPDGCYGRMFFVDGVSRQTVAAGFLNGLNRNRYAKCFVYDFLDTIEWPPDWTVELLSTTLVDISSPDWEPPHESLRRGIKKAEREEIVVERFDAKRHMEKFMSLMRTTEARHGRAPKYPKVFYNELASLAERDERLHWLWCEHQGSAVASHIYIVEGSQLIYWQGYFDPEFSFLRPNQYMHFHTARRYAEKGLTILNLGGSPPEAEKLQEYKDRWGGTTHSYKCYWRKSWLGKLL